MTITKQLQAIIDEMSKPTGNVIIRARAGSGKTTAILTCIEELVKLYVAWQLGVCAFNKAISEEIKDKLRALGLDERIANTIHSMGYGLVRFAFGSRVDGAKVRKILKPRAANSKLYQEYLPQIDRLVHSAKQEGVGFFDDKPIEDAAVWHQIIDHYDINGFDDTSQASDIVCAAQDVYRTSLGQTDVVDFDDMILFPLIKNLTVKYQKDALFVDEAQDLSHARQALIRKFVKPDGRLIIVGDDKQAIYGFSGADADALIHFKTALNAEDLPLSISWRCPVAGVKLAQTIVPDIEWAPGAKEGEVVKDCTELPNDLGPESAILCRNMAPLVNTAYGLIRRGIACKVEGRDIGEGLIELFNRWKVRTLDQFEGKLADYKNREIQKALAKDREDRVQTLQDKCETAMAIVDECRLRKLYNVTDAINFVNDLFEDKNTKVLTLATYHRSKGREWERVFLYEHNRRCPSKYAKQQWQKDQESNLAYVAFTRSKDKLFFYSPTEAKKVKPTQEVAAKEVA